MTCRWLRSRPVPESQLAREQAEAAAYCRPAVRNLKSGAWRLVWSRKFDGFATRFWKNCDKVRRKNKNAGSDDGLWRNLSPRSTAFADSSPY